MRIASARTGDGDDPVPGLAGPREKGPLIFTLDERVIIFPAEDIRVAAPEPTSRSRFEERSFLWLLLLITILFALVVAPFFGAILWALVLAILFGPVHRDLVKRFGGRRNLAAIATLTVIIVLVVLPAVLLTTMVIDELLSFYTQIQSGKIDIAALFGRATRALPDWASDWLRRMGWGDFSAVQAKLTALFTGSFGALATRGLAIGQGAFNALLLIGVMLYLAFFLIRDGETLGRRVMDSVPLDQDKRLAIVNNFTLVVRATIKGSLIVAIVQGIIGGVTFSLLGLQGALLWGTLMGVFSLIPAIGTGIIWAPVALYLIATGAVMKGLILTACGVLIISMVDNVLRPILVGRDTRMPDYLVLISTLGGLQLFGFHGFIVGPVVAALFLGIWKIFDATRTNARA